MGGSPGSAAVDSSRLGTNRGIKFICRTAPGRSQPDKLDARALQLALNDLPYRIVATRLKRLQILTAFFGLPEFTERSIQGNFVIQTSPRAFPAKSVECPVPATLVVDSQLIGKICGHTFDPAVAPELTRDDPLGRHVVTSCESLHRSHDGFKVVDVPHGGAILAGGHPRRIGEAAFVDAE